MGVKKQEEEPEKNYVRFKKLVFLFKTNNKLSDVKTSKLLTENGVDISPKTVGNYAVEMKKQVIGTT